MNRAAPHAAVARRSTRRWAGRARQALVALAALALLAAPGFAQQDSLEAAKRKELEEVRRLARENREAATRLKGQETQELGKLHKAERQLNMTRKRLTLLQRRRKNLDSQLAGTRVDLERSMLSLDQRRQQLARRVRNLYKYGSARELEFLLSTRSFAELMARWDYLVLVAKQDRQLLEGISQRKEQVEATEQQIQGNLVAIAQNTKLTTRESRRLDDLRAQRTLSVEQIRTQRQAYEAAAAELDRTARQIQKLLAALESRRQSAPAVPYTGEFAKGRGALDWPVRGKIVTTFGPETHPRFGTTTLNNGVDIAAPSGTPVQAVGRGRVDFTNDDFGSFGQVVVLNHGDGFYTLYGHLSEILVTNGQEVQAGQAIGRVGESGTSLKGTVLHFEVRKGANALDPEDWLK